MKKLIIPLIFVLFCLQLQAKEPTKYGYYVFIQKCTDTYNENFESLDSCYLYIAQFYPDFCTDLEFVLQRSPYYRENCYKREVYVERMRITKSGKYKRIKNFKNYLNEKSNYLPTDDVSVHNSRIQ